MGLLLKKVLLRVFTFLLMASFASWLFVKVEYTERDNAREKRALLLSLYSSMASKYSMTVEEFNNISIVAHEALSDPKPQWTFIVAFELVVNIVTTIGYGNITPQTSSGQVLCIFVCLLGIPVTLLTLKSISDLIAKGVNTIVRRFEKKILKRSEAKHVRAKGVLILFVFMVMLMIENALVMMYLQKWTFLEGVYYWFVTFTTVGFGDYVVSEFKPQDIKMESLNSSVHDDNSDESTDAQVYNTYMVFSRMYSVIYLLVCLCIVSSILNSMVTAMEGQNWRPLCPGVGGRPKVTCKVVCSMDPLIKAALIRTLAFLVWILLSAWLFTVVEFTGKDESKEKHQLLISLYTSMASKYNMTRVEFNNFSNTAFEALSSPKPRWNFALGVNFVVQAATTIGYGNITPQTPVGQVLCIFACMFGIPIALLTLNSVGALIARLVNTIVKKFEKKILKREQPKHVKTKSAFISFLLMMFFMAVNALVLALTEDWTYLEGVYFSFVTFTTVGFGDYIAKMNDESSQEILLILQSMVTTLYLIGGLCIVSSVLNSIVAAMDERNWRFRYPRCISRRTQDRVDTTKQLDDVNTTSVGTQNLGLQNDENIVSVEVTDLK